MKLPAFVLHRPRTVDDVSALVAEHGNDCDLVAGGTDLLPNYKFRLHPKPHVISLAAVEGLDALGPRRIGAGVTLERIERNDGFTGPLAVLRECARQISSPPLRAMGTLGGNLLLDTRCWFLNQSPLWRESKGSCLKAEGEHCLVIPNSSGACYATYSGEMAAALLVLGAEVELHSVRGARRVPLQDLFGTDGIRRIGDKRPDEWLVAVHLPEREQDVRGAYEKLRQRLSIDFPSLGVAVAVQVEDGMLRSLSLATTALVSRPELRSDVAGPFVGQPVNSDLAARIGVALQRASKAYKNVPLDPAYRKKMVAVLTRRALVRAHAGFSQP